MNKREKREAERLAKEKEPVTNESLQYWANYPVGGSGLSTTIQTQLKKMSIELLTFRGVEIEEEWNTDG